MANLEFVLPPAPTTNVKVAFGQDDLVRRSASNISPPAKQLTPVSKLIDVSKCIGCKACQVACLEWNDMHQEIGFNHGVYDNPLDLTPESFTVRPCTEALPLILPDARETVQGPRGLMVVGVSSVVSRDINSVPGPASMVRWFTAVCSRCESVMVTSGLFCGPYRMAMLVMVNELWVRSLESSTVSCLTSVTETGAPI